MPHLKETTKQVLDSFKVCYGKLFEEIEKQHVLHKTDDDQTKAFYTRKVINKWFRQGGNI